MLPAKRPKMDVGEQNLSPTEKMQKLIDNCAALKLEEPELGASDPSCPIGGSYVYTTADREYSQIWTKQDVLDDEPIYYYYRIQIAGLRKDGYDEEGNYMFVQNWGAFDTINHRKRSDYLPLTQCLQRFMIQSAERSRNFIFAKIKENDISKYPLSETVQELIAKYIFEMNFLKKMINEYTFDVKSTITEFLDVTTQVQPGEINTTLTYDKVRELLKKEITCQLTVKNEGKSRTFSLMNFYYKQLHTTIKVLDTKTDRYKIIKKYFFNFQSSKNFYPTLQLKNVFEIERPCDNHRYTKDLNNKKLLWHGTSTQNIPSILYEGFRTTKARSTGLFGAGTYFANSVSKSLAYCQNTGGVLLLCEVALGDSMQCTKSCKQLLQEDGTLPDGKNSVHGKGSMTPDVNDSTVIDGDVLVPYGKLSGEEHSRVTSLLHDEFIVYNPAQIKMRYLITTQF